MNDTRLAGRRSAGRAASRRRLSRGAVVVAAIVLAGCGGSSIPSQSEQVSRAMTAVRNLPVDGFTLGRPTAPALLTGFVSLDDPGLSAFMSTDLPRLAKDDVASGKLRIQIRPIAEGEADTNDAWGLARYALGAAIAKNDYWSALAWIGPSYLGIFAKEDRAMLLHHIGLTNQTAFDAVAESARVTNAISRATATATSSRLDSGSFVLTRPGQAPLTLKYAAPGSLAAAVSRALGA